MYKCECGKECISKRGFSQHKNRCDGNGTSDQKRKKAREERLEKLVCEKCGSNFVNIWNFKLHQTKCDGKGKRSDREKMTLSEAVSRMWKNPEYRSKQQTNIKRISQYYQTLSEKQKDEWKKRRSEEMKSRYEKGWESRAGRTRKIHYKSNIAGEVLLDGSWELKTAIFFDENNIKWERNKKRFAYKDREKNRTYCPDFLLLESNVYVEVKGYITDLDKLKWNQFTEKLEIWDKAVLFAKGILR